MPIARTCLWNRIALKITECNYIYIYYVWFDFDALAQGNAYKPTKEPINYRGPGGDRTHNLQTEATPPAASCPARSHHATEIVSKHTIPITCPMLHWTTNNPSGMHRCQFQHMCVLVLNCALVPAIYIFVWFGFDALPQGNAYKPTKEPINHCGPGGHRTHDIVRTCSGNRIENCGM